MGNLLTYKPEKGELDKEDFTFYILMRTDLDSLNPGKAMAQASHAYGALKFAIRSKLTMQKEYLAWASQTPQSFGKTLVFGANFYQIDNILERAKSYFPKVVSGWVHDPTYPIRDGRVTHYIPLNTCAFLFGYEIELAELVSHEDIELYR